MGKNKKPYFFHNLMGARLDNWLRLMRHNHISKEHEGHARIITLISLVLAIPAFLEWLIFYLPIKYTKLRMDPVYIVGFWRSGTTFLQNVLTRDPQFGWFDPVSTVSFSNAILLRGFLRRAIAPFLKDARPMDNLDYTMDLPMEEVFALATISENAISHMLAFPDGGKGVRYIETAFVGEQSVRMQRKWRRSYDYIIKKVSYINRGKQLILKSPENTCRIGELKKYYPGAKFIHIYRNPYDVVLSAINMFEKEMKLLALNDPAPPSVIENTAIDLFAKVYGKAIEELDSMPRGDCINIRYEDFCKDPEGGLREIYTQLGLSGYKEARPYLDDYLGTQKGYRKNRFELKPAVRDKVNDKLGFYFKRYKYSMITE